MIIDAIKYLVELGIDVDDLHRKLEDEILKQEEARCKVTTSLIPMAEYTKKLIKEAEVECEKLKESYLGTSHIMLSILKEKNNITKILKKMGVDYKNYDKGTVKNIL